MARNYSETQLKAKELGIPNWHVIGVVKLKKAIALKEIENLTLTETVNTGESEDEYVDSDTNTSNSSSSSVPTEEVIEKVELPADVERKVMIWSIKCIGNKSPYYKYKSLLGM